MILSSNYDSYHWMTAYGDPGFVVHKAMGQFLTLLAYHLADDPVIPLDLPNYTTQLRSYLAELRATITEAGVELDVGPLAAAIDTFEASANKIAALAAEATITGDDVLVDQVNSKYRDFQRGFTSQGGLPDRSFFKHVVFAPGVDTGTAQVVGSKTQLRHLLTDATGYAPVTYPGITEAVDAGNTSLASSELQRTVAAVEAAAAILIA
jgi:N-acetylated-alpha-linked acidic dipeptidase